MPATYTYNDAIDDVLQVVVRAFESCDDVEKQMPFMLKMVGSISDLKRPSRRKRHPSPPNSEDAE